MRYHVLHWSYMRGNFCRICDCSLNTEADKAKPCIASPRIVLPTVCDVCGTRISYAYRNESGCAIPTKIAYNCTCHGMGGMIPEDVPHGRLPVYFLEFSSGKYLFGIDDDEGFVAYHLPTNEKQWREIQISELPESLHEKALEYKNLKYK